MNLKKADEFQKEKKSPNVTICYDNPFKNKMQGKFIKNKWAFLQEEIFPDLNLCIGKKRA